MLLAALAAADTVDQGQLADTLYGYVSDGAVSDMRIAAVGFDAHAATRSALGDSPLRARVMRASTGDSTDTLIERLKRRDARCVVVVRGSQRFTVVPSTGCAGVEAPAPPPPASTNPSSTTSTSRPRASAPSAATTEGPEQLMLDIAMLPDPGMASVYGVVVGFGTGHRLCDDDEMANILLGTQVGGLLASVVASTGNSDPTAPALLSAAGGLTFLASRGYEVASLPSACRLQRRRAVSRLRRR